MAVPDLHYSLSREEEEGPGRESVILQALCLICNVEKINMLRTHTNSLITHCTDHAPHQTIPLANLSRPPIRGEFYLDLFYPDYFK